MLPSSTEASTRPAHYRPSRVENRETGPLVEDGASMITEATAAFEGHFAAMGGDFSMRSPDSITDDFIQEPQSGERVRGKEACMNIFRNYPGGGRRHDFGGMSGEGDLAGGRHAVRRQADLIWWRSSSFAEWKISHETDYWG
jgi:hypothetical protein